uniref:Probable 4-coumarate--CoA ligase 3 n=1 Tax=Culex pipiens TaxID=7175 RepID=A0A8D8JBA1_CULPI
MFPTFDPDSKVWTGPKLPSVFNPEVNFGKVLLATMCLNPDKVIQYDADTGRTMTNGEMQLRAIRASQNLAALGLRQGDMAALACTNSENVMPVVVAMFFNGIPFNTLAPGHEVDDLAHMMRITQPKLVFCDVDNYERVKEATEVAVRDKPLLYVFESDLESVNKAEDLLKETGRERMFLPTSNGDARNLPGIVLCSSGITDLPKAVTLSHAQLVSMYGSLVGVFKFSLLFNFSPLYWISGLHSLGLSLIHGIPRVITRKPFSEDTFFDLFEKYPIDYFFTPPSHAHLLLQHPRFKTADFSRVRTWLVGGSPVPDTLRDTLETKLPNGKTVMILGTSEIGFVTTDFFKRKPLSVGMAAPNVRIKIVNEVGKALNNGERGEIWMTFSEKFLGYYNTPEVTAAAVDADGWIRTGDVGYFDEEGYLYLEGRQKDMLKWRGYQIAPADLEAILRDIEGVDQAYVVGLLDEDGSSDLATAVVVKVEGSELTEADILEVVNGKVADYKKLRGGVYFVEEVPFTSNGKILRKKLIEQVKTMTQKKN